jgi:hypothetical protein
LTSQFNGFHRNILIRQELAHQSHR